MILKKVTKNPFIVFLPFLVFYILIILLFPSNASFGDESRYIIYTKYMISGHLPLGEGNFETLGNGPGYSILLIPFLALKLPLIYITLMNAVFFYFSIIFIYKTLEKFVTHRKVIVVCIFWGLYLNLYESIIKVLPETFITFLVSALILTLVNAFHTKDFKKYIVLSGVLIGYIGLTKPIFGYVLIVMLAGCGLLWLFKRKVATYKKQLVILLIALATTLPYLVYTYNLTGKMFYWSSFGGTSLYWMTAPSENEYGSWFQDIPPNSQGVIIDSMSAKKLIKNYEVYIRADHQKDFEEINKYSGTEKDSIYKRIAISNIKSHPGKFIQNCISNAGRVIFNFPFSYKLQNPHTLIRLPFNGIIVVLMLFCMIPAFKNWRKIEFPFRFLLFFAMVYFGGSLFGSAETRMFTVIVPILLCWIAYIFERSFKIKFTFD